MLGLHLPAWATAPRSPPFWAGVGAAAAVVLLGVAALGGAFYGVDTHRFTEWRELYDRFFPAAARPWAK